MYTKFADQNLLEMSSTDETTPSDAETFVGVESFTNGDNPTTGNGSTSKVVDQLKKESVAETSVATHDAGVESSKSPSAASAPAVVVPKSEQHESDELTKRLQKLALERQKESKGERLKVIQSDSAQQHLSSVKTFQELNLPAHLLDAIFAMGFDRPSAIQEEALPRILADPPRNLIGQAQSGSGKVSVFGWLRRLYREWFLVAILI